MLLRKGKLKTKILGWYKLILEKQSYRFPYNSISISSYEILDDHLVCLKQSEDHCSKNL